MLVNKRQGNSWSAEADASLEKEEHGKNKETAPSGST
jgi:hypothetical protein